MSENTVWRIANYGQMNEKQFCCWFAEGDGWYLNVPGCGLATLRNHKVEEHADGTITVTPSIRVTGHDSGQPVTRHGWVTAGVWRDA